MPELPPTYVEGFHDKEKVLKMKYNDLGTTGLKVSQLSFGGGAFSRFYSEFDKSEAIETVREALRSGINYIDTAPWYGQGQSEELLGEALEGVPRQAYYMATKVGRYELNYEDMFDFGAEKVRRGFEESLKKLRLDYVDVIQVHDIEFAPSLDVVLAQTLPCLDALRRAGLARHVGVTGYPVSTLRACVDASKRRDDASKQRVPIDVVLAYCRHSMIDATLDEHADFFEKSNVGIIGAAAHAMGLLTNGGPQPWHPASAHAKETCKRAAEYCASKNVELGRLAFWHALQNRDVATNLVGMNTRALLHSNLSVIYDGLTKEEEQAFHYVNETFLKGLKNCQWEGVELKNYWSYMNKDGETTKSGFL